MDDTVIGSYDGHDIYISDNVIKITGFDEYEFPSYDEACEFLNEYEKS